MGHQGSICRPVPDASPDNQIVPDSQWNELFAMHGTIMLLLFAT